MGPDLNSSSGVICGKNSSQLYWIIRDKINKRNKRRNQDFFRGTLNSPISVSLLKRIRVFSNFLAFIPTCSKRQMWINFTGVESLGTALKLEQSKKNSPSCVYFHGLQTTWHFKKFHLITLDFLQVPPCAPCVSSWKCREAYSASHPQV